MGWMEGEDIREKGNDKKIKIEKKEKGREDEERKGERR